MGTLEPIDFTGIERVLVVTAHPDDVDFSWAGMVARLTDAGIEVSYCIVTDGDAGGSETGIPRAEMGPKRREEQTAAAAVVGVHDVHFLGYPDGRVEPTLELRRDVSRVIRQVRPDRVILQSPVRNIDFVYASHPDHLAVAEAGIAAVYPDARNRWAHPELEAEGHEPWTVPQVWLSARGDDQTHFVDITDTIARKIDALLCHKTQSLDPEAMGELLRGWAKMNAESAGLPDGRYAEGLRVINTG
jgi:LmbE family N-acetylglucosaminyl deacetylase